MTEVCWSDAGLHRPGFDSRPTVPAPRHQRWGRRADDQREGVRRDPTIQPDALAYTGDAATMQAAERARALRARFCLIRRFQREGFSQGNAYPNTISLASEEAAIAVLMCLSPDHELPRIVPDDEGGVIMAWETVGKMVLLTIDGWCLHLVRAPASDPSDYLDDVLFDGEVLPEVIDVAIPKK